MNNVASKQDDCTMQNAQCTTISLWSNNYGRTLRENLQLTNRLHKKITTTIFAFLLLGFLIVPQMIRAQAPIIDCNDNITCGQAEPWEWHNNLGFSIDGCYINPRFRISKCCTGSICKYIVDLNTIVTFTNNCAKTPEEIRIEAIKFIMSKTPELFNIGIYESYELHLKQPKCMTYENYNFFTMNYSISTPCDPECCLAVYQLASFPDKVRLINQFPYTNNYVTCVEPGGTGCSFTCNSVDFTPPLDIPFSDYNGGGGDPCLADCFWRLGGNSNVTSQSFIGPTNNQALILKTVENSIHLAPNNIPTIEVSVNPTCKTVIQGKVYISVPEIDYYDLPSDIRLAVGGKIIAEEVIVKLKTSWPDYVFRDDYDLIPLNQLESRIKERGALPGIPTAEEMQKDANIPIGEMNLKLLQKIEELTLYLIELENKNQGLEQRMKLLEGK